MTESENSLKSSSRTSLVNNVIALVAVAFVFFIATLIFLYFNNSRYLEDFKVLLSENEISSHKMQLFSEFAELARGRTRNTIQILESDDVFEQDELNQQLEGFAGKFADVRERLDLMPFSPDDRKLYDSVFGVVAQILPRQRKAVELLMHDGDREEARRLIYESVLPGQQNIIDVFHELIRRQRQHITSNSVLINQSMLEINQHNNLLFGFILVLFSGMSGFIIFRISRIQRQVSSAYEGLEETVQERTHDLKLARDAAVTANKSKSEFLSSMSHELRTPLNAIIGFSQLLEMEEMDPLQKDSVVEIHKAGKHLLDLINEVLDLARIEAGRMSADMQEVDLHTVLSEVYSLSEPIAARYGIRLDLEANTGYKVFADYKRIKQVFLNLINNAIKYNRENGSVSVYTENMGNKVRIFIKDTGKGIAEENREGLFEPFNRLGAEGSEIEGTGIGMMVTSQLVELMHGHIDFSSTLGEGSTFWVDFELMLADGDNLAVDDNNVSQQTNESMEKDGALVLYIEDNLTNQKLMQGLFSRYTGYHLLLASTPLAGLEIAYSVNPDIILLDINMPEMDGFEVLKKLKAAKETEKTPVIAVTSRAMPENISEGLKAGFDDYLTKPVDIKKLMSSMEEMLRD